MPALVFASHGQTLKLLDESTIDPFSKTLAQPVAPKRRRLDSATPPQCSRRLMGCRTNAKRVFQTTWRAVGVSPLIPQFLSASRRTRRGQDSSVSALLDSRRCPPRERRVDSRFNHLTVDSIQSRSSRGLPRRTHCRIASNSFSLSAALTRSTQLGKRGMGQGDRSFGSGSIAWSQRHSDPQRHKVFVFVKNRQSSVSPVESMVNRPLLHPPVWARHHCSPNLDLWPVDLPQSGSIQVSYPLIPRNEES
jgi:hypothetical protein